MADTVNSLRLIVYCSDTSESGEKILALGQRLAPRAAFIAHRDLAGFSDALKRPGFKVLLIAIRQDRELEEMLRLKAWLDGQAIVLILPDEKPASAPHMLTRALRLYPRYISNSRREFSDVETVLKKIIHNHGGNL